MYGVFDKNLPSFTSCSQVQDIPDCLHLAWAHRCQVFYKGIFKLTCLCYIGYFVYSSDDFTKVMKQLVQYNQEYVISQVTANSSQFY